MKKIAIHWKWRVGLKEDGFQFYFLVQESGDALPFGYDATLILMEPLLPSSLLPQQLYLQTLSA